MPGDSNVHDIPHFYPETIQPDSYRITVDLLVYPVQCQDLHFTDLFARQHCLGISWQPPGYTLGGTAIDVGTVYYHDCCGTWIFSHVKGRRRQCKIFIKRSEE